MRKVNCEEVSIWIFDKSTQQETGCSAVKANYCDWHGTKFTIKTKAINLFSFSLHGKH